MDSDIMESILSRLDRKMFLEKRNVVLFWDSTTCHPETLQASLSFYPKIQHREYNLLTPVVSEL